MEKKFTQHELNQLQVDKLDWLIRLASEHGTVLTGTELQHDSESDWRWTIKFESLTDQLITAVRSGLSNYPIEIRVAPMPKGGGMTLRN